MHSTSSRPTYSRKEKKNLLAISSQSKCGVESITEQSVWKDYIHLLQHKQKKNSNSFKHNETTQEDTNPITLLIDEKLEEVECESMLMSIIEYSKKEQLINELENLVAKEDHPPIDHMDLVFDLQGSRGVILALVQPNLLSMEFTPLQLVERHDDIDLKHFAMGIILDLRINPFLDGRNRSEEHTLNSSH